MTDLLVSDTLRPIGEYAYLILALVFVAWGVIRTIAAFQGRNANLLTVPEWVAAVFEFAMAGGLVTAWILLLLLRTPQNGDLIATVRVWTLTFRMIAAVIGTVMVSLYYGRMADRLLKDFKQWRRERAIQEDYYD